MSNQWTTEAYPAVPPNEKFRQDLQRALEQTHRQQMAQRKLHPPPARKRTPDLLRFTIVFALLLALLAAFMWRQDRQAETRRTAP
jgi:hypothetical protein